jgi:pyruvate/2-oxoglutarate/acetoin dehydrogenase E1 component
MRLLSYSQAIAEALAEEMRRDPSVCVWGIDIGPYGGAFAATKGLFEEFGPERVIDMPVSELGYVGVGVGAAATGLRPVVELQFSDWITLASEMLINQAAKMRYMFGGVISVPMVLRAPVGGYLSAAAQHSDSFESMFAFVPGLKVVLPSTPYDAKGLLKSAIRDNNPVMYVESQLLYSMKGVVPEEDYVVPLGQAAVKREGKDLTFVAWGPALQDCLKAAEKLASEKGVSAEVVDIRCLVPLDLETILRSVRKTGRCVVASQAIHIGSYTGEIASTIMEQAFDYLDAPVLRVGAKNGIAPQSHILEAAFLPNVGDLVAAAKSIL